MPAKTIGYKNPGIRPPLVRLIVILFAIALSGMVGAQQPSSAKLARLEFEGLQRLPKDQLIKASGLELGQTVTVEALDAAAQRLMDSGLLKKLSYHFRTNANQATVVFLIEEAPARDSPVIFDNFIWFTDEELANAVRREVPYFSGTAPDAGNVTAKITSALQHFMSEHKIGGKVEYMPSSREGSNKLDHVFAVRGIAMPICTLHFPGAENVAEARLIKSSKDLLGIDYSRTFASAFAVSNLFPIYRELGQLRAAFAVPSAKPEATANCKEGVDVTIPVAEGPIYKWDKAEWSGNKVLTPEQLDAAVGMKPDEVASGVKIDKGMIGVHKAYGRQGYIAASLRLQAVFDDQASKVSYRIEITEGPQYHMGNLFIKGLPDNLTNLLRGKWEMRPGDVFDQGYVDDFFKGPFRDLMRKVVEDRQTQGKPAPKNVSTDAKPNTRSLTVDVTIEIKD